METILCPTDFSETADNAIWYADELAQRMNSRMVLFHNIYQPAGAEYITYSGEPYAYPVRDPAYEQELEAKMETFINTLQETNWGIPIRYESSIKYGYPKDTIPEAAQAARADLVVLGSAGTEGLKGIFVGSLAADIIEKLSCPVLIIPHKAKFHPLHKIVFATDLRGEPFTDVAFVSKLAGLFEGEILFLHIVANESAASKQRAEAELIQIQKRIPYHNVSFYTETSDQIEAGISQFCQRHQADMLVMGYHPRPFWQHLFTQDYTLQMAYHTNLPLLVIHYKP